MSGEGPRVKVCGLVREADARAAREAGADYLGVILSSGFARSVAPADARTLRAAAGPPLVGVLVDEAPAAAVAVAVDAGVDLLQLHGDEPPATLRALREEGPWRLWKAVRPRSADDIVRAAERYVGLADALLLDGWHPERKGGSGTLFPWGALEEARERMPDGLRLVAAGGLTPDNVAEAVARLRPDVVDVSSGVEARPGEKDRAKLEAFVRAARGPAAPDDRDEGRR